MRAHSFLDLPLVGLDLLLEFVDKVLHSLDVLTIFVALECQLLDSALGLAVVLGGLRVTALLVIQFVLNFAYLSSNWKQCYVALSRNIGKKDTVT